jgi:LacI family transcriptional regulator
MRLDEPPTAIFATTGSMATGAYRALMELGLRVPHDVSLLAFDDYPWMRLVDPGIDTLAQPVEAMGRRPCVCCSTRCASAPTRRSSASASPPR